MSLCFDVWLISWSRDSILAESEDWERSLLANVIFVNGTVVVCGFEDSSSRNSDCVQPEPETEIVDRILLNGYVLLPTEVSNEVLLLWTGLLRRLFLEFFWLRFRIRSSCKSFRRNYEGRVCIYWLYRVCISNWIRFRDIRISVGRDYILEGEGTDFLTAWVGLKVVLEFFLARGSDYFQPLNSILVCCVQLLCGSCVSHRCTLLSARVTCVGKVAAKIFILKVYFLYDRTHCQRG
jgi:hypothetical protein